VDQSSIKRRLTCILAADAVGYSKQMGQDEEGTIRVLSAHRAVIDGIITFHQGRIVSTAGDSVLAEFSSAVEAVRCAVEIQDALKTRNDSLEEHRQMHFRVGVNLGDVVVKNEDLLGDGVNVAARLESMAEPGGICISSSVYDQITGKLDLGFQDIGEQNLKNISRPIRVYRVSGTAAPLRPLPPAAPPVPPTNVPTPENVMLAPPVDVSVPTPPPPAVQELMFQVLTLPDLVRISLIPASSSTARGAEPAITPVPPPAGISITLLAP
jgi:class 3 adenylate cyclase